MVYKCQICGYIYDEAKENVPFKDLPANWKCPWCGAEKTDFALVSTDQGKEEVKREVRTEKSVAKSTDLFDADLTRLTPGQLSAICSNLARGCEKQYKDKESELFKELASYFNSITPAVKDGTVEKLSAILQSDVDNYPDIRATADANGDRGAARICVWGEKVTRMLNSLVSRYLKEGDSMLADTAIWVCTVCGFVYVGDEAPELCPVCKVPSWKFEEIEGRK